jgi:uncharacterized protein (DUF58 family)
MSDAERFLDPAALRKIERLELRARRVVEGFLAGRHRSQRFGSSVEFLRHREYAAGDDPRYIDWKAWARQDRLYVKQFEEETNFRLSLVLDVSAGMQYGEGPLNKYEYACTIAACLAYMALRRQDAVGCVAFDQKVRATVPLRTKRTHMKSLLRAFDVNRPADKTDISVALRSVAESIPRQSVVVLISDLLVDRKDLWEGLKLLRSRGHDLLIFHVLDDDELDFTFTGATKFEGMEDDHFLRCNPRALREGYLEAIHEYLEDVRHGCARLDADYELLRTRMPLDAALSAFLARREGAARKR